METLTVGLSPPPPAPSRAPGSPPPVPSRFGKFLRPSGAGAASSARGFPAPVHSPPALPDSSGRPRGGEGRGGQRRQQPLPGTRRRAGSGAGFGANSSPRRARAEVGGTRCRARGQAQPWRRVPGPGRELGARGPASPGLGLCWPSSGARSHAGLSRARLLSLGEGGPAPATVTSPPPRRLSASAAPGMCNRFTL